MQAAVGAMAIKHVLSCMTSSMWLQGFAGSPLDWLYFFTEIQLYNVVADHGSSAVSSCNCRSSCDIFHVAAVLMLGWLLLLLLLLLRVAHLSQAPMTCVCAAMECCRAW
jgi:hypothetical protein